METSFTMNLSSQLKPSFKLTTAYIRKDIDGHFWVVRDGKIIDPHFKEYDILATEHNWYANKKNYIEAPQATQKIVVVYLKRITEINTKLLGEEEATKTGYGLCFQNATQEIAKNGGRLVFGSMGFKIKNKDGFFYQYGGLNKMKMTDFITTDY